MGGSDERMQLTLLRKSNFQKINSTGFENDRREKMVISVDVGKTFDTRQSPPP
jgi:hypothetical protein